MSLSPVPGHNVLRAQLTVIICHLGPSGSHVDVLTHKIPASEVVFVAGREIIDVNTEVKWPAWLPGDPRINMDFDTTHRARLPDTEAIN